MGMHRKREDVQFLITSRVERLHLKLIFKLSKSVIAFVKINFLFLKVLPEFNDRKE